MAHCPAKFILVKFSNSPRVGRGMLGFTFCFPSVKPAMYNPIGPAVHNTVPTQSSAPLSAASSGSFSPWSALPLLLSFTRCESRHSFETPATTADYRRSQIWCPCRDKSGNYAFRVFPIAFIVVSGTSASLQRNCDMRSIQRKRQRSPLPEYLSARN